jgi:hypothetical protein
VLALPLLTTNRLLRPLAKLIGVFDDLHWHLIVALERLFGVGPKRFHLALSIFRDGRFVDLKIQTALVDNAEKCFVLIEAIAAEHAPRRDIVQITQLIQNQIFERIVFHCGYIVLPALEWIRFNRLP